MYNYEKNQARTLIIYFYQIKVTKKNIIISHDKFIIMINDTENIKKITHLMC